MNRIANRSYKLDGFSCRAYSKINAILGELPLRNVTLRSIFAFQRPVLNVPDYSNDHSPRRLLRLVRIGVERVGCCILEVEAQPGRPSDQSDQIQDLHVELAENF